MPTLQSKVTAKGQITLPKPIRSQLAIRVGDRLEFSIEQANKISVRKMRPPGASAGCGVAFVSPGQSPVSVVQMKDGIRRAVAAKHGSGTRRMK